MTLLQVFVIFIIFLVSIIVYALARASANSDREYEQDENCEMIETKDEYRNDKL